jgi:hypothetical protein
MTALDVAAMVIDSLNQAGAAYMLVGSLSSNLYGTPRNTNDAGFVLSSATGDMSSIMHKLGDGFWLERQASFESVTGTLRRTVTHTQTGFVIELFALSDDPHDLARFSRRRQIDFLGRPTFVPTVEDVIIMKLRWAVIARREKDIADVRNILIVQPPDRIDMAYVRNWTQSHGSDALLGQMLAESQR